jgi:OmcA/MtrC family decaheme c-type cytochrome
MSRMPAKHLAPLALAALVLAGCDDGSDGKDGQFVVDLSRLSDTELAELDVVSEITRVTVSSPPKVDFTLVSGNGDPLVGLLPFWEASNRFIRFTLTKLVPGIEGDPDAWVPYTRDAATDEPDYDTGTALVDHGDGSYTFTFATDVTAVPGVSYEPSLTHRVAGQLGDGAVPLEAQNLVFDFVPAGGVVSTRAIAVMETCNECHDDLVFHGRRFLVEYCVNCHTKDLASGEGDFPFMIHKIHDAGEFAVLDGGVSFAEVTYPQDVLNCRKCHDGTEPATPQGDNWKDRPHRDACFSCHSQDDHPGGPPPAANKFCVECHDPGSIEADHLTPNPTPNNPGLLEGQMLVAYELLAASVDGMSNEVTIDIRILADGTPLDVANLPADLAGPGRYPGFVLAWALPQSGIDAPMDYNNLGGRAAQPLSLALDDFLAGGTAGTHAFDGATGVNTFVVTDAASQFPVGSTLRAVGLEGYFQQDIAGEIVSLHTPSAVVAVTGDAARRMVVDSASCASCHEWFEGHGGTRTFNIQNCTLCHVPNLSSTGRTVTNPADRGLEQALADAIAAGTLDPSVDPGDPLTYPEDAQNLKDLIHGIHSSGFRTRPFQHVRGPSRQSYYDWSEVTFPASTSNCSLCHAEDSYALPVPEDVLPTTVRTTGAIDGRDPTIADAENAFVSTPGVMDWVNSPNAAACLGCHTDEAALAHMEVNGAQISVPIGLFWTNRSMMGSAVESCSICHGPGKSSDIQVLHDF